MSKFSRALLFQIASFIAFVAVIVWVGRSPMVTHAIFDAQRNFRDTYRSYITSRAAYWRAVYRYGAAIGQQIYRTIHSPDAAPKR